MPSATNAKIAARCFGKITVTPDNGIATASRHNAACHYGFLLNAAIADEVTAAVLDLMGIDLGAIAGLPIVDATLRLHQAAEIAYSFDDGSRWAFNDLVEAGRRDQADSSKATGEAVRDRIDVRLRLAERMLQRRLTRSQSRQAMRALQGAPGAGMTQSAFAVTESVRRAPCNATVKARSARRTRGAGRPRASASRSSARSGDSGDSGSPSGGGGDGPPPAPLLLLVHPRYGRVNGALAHHLRRVVA